MADPFDFSQLGISQPAVQPGADPRIISGGPASGIPPEMQPRPPANEAELQQRVGGWQKFLQTLATDKNLTNSLLSFGTTALQPRIGGQTQAGQIGKAVQAGQQTYQQGQRADRQEGFQQQQIDISKQNAAAYGRTADAQVRATDASISRQEQTLPLELQAIKERIQAAKNANDPERVGMELDLLFQEIQARGADTAYKRAMTAYIPDEIAAKYVRAGQPAAAVQELRAVAGALVATGAADSAEEGMIQAYEQAHQSRLQTPDQFRATMLDALNRADLLNQPNISQAIEAIGSGYENYYNSQQFGVAKPKGPGTEGPPPLIARPTAIPAPTEKQFNSVEEATAAAQRGEIKNGDSVIIGGRRATWKE